jgi:hypothetical protein
MGSSDDLLLEERRLALEERKWADEVELRKNEAQAKAKENSWKAKLFSPLTATLLAGIVTVGGSVTATLIQNHATQNIERQKEQHELILKMITVDNVEQARKNIRFLTETELITDKDLAQRLVAAKETPLIKPITVTPPPVGLAPTLTADDVRRQVSDEAVKMMIDAEIGGDASYKKYPHWVGASGGVTIGIGYDLGYVLLDQFKADWSPYLAQVDVGNLAGSVGIKGESAKVLIPPLSSIEIRWDDAMAVFYATLPQWAAALERNLPNVRELPPDAYGALLSLVYNRGTPFKSSGDRFTEMREIRSLMGKKEYTGIPQQLRLMKRLWPSLPKLVLRREKEALLFEKGLAQLSPPAR